MRIKLGLKVWSTNISLIPEAIMLYEKQKLEYVEVFCVPGTETNTSKLWAESKLPVIIHAPHSMTGLNLAIKEMRDSNRYLAEESYRFADAVGAEKVIFHPGMNGELGESIKQIRHIFDKRMLIENKPYRGLKGGNCIGSTPEEISQIIESSGIGFCLDFGHAVAAANSHNRDLFTFINQFTVLSPSMYHMTDGDISSELDHHKKYGTGSFPLDRFLSMIPTDAMVTDEAERERPDSVEEYSIDRNWITCADSRIKL